MLVFKRLHLTPGNCDFVDPKVSFWISPYQNQKHLDYIQIEMVKATIKETGPLLYQL